MRRIGIPARDLRILDPALSYPSTILGREQAIVVNLEHVKAIITATEMLILNSKDPSVATFVSNLECKLSNFDASQSPAIKGSGMAIEDSPSDSKPEASNSSPKVSFNALKMDGQKVLPFEFRVLEICLQFVCGCLESETSTLEQEAYPALDELSVSIGSLNLQRVRLIKNRLVALFGRVQKVRDELQYLLDDDMDMAEMYLTDKLDSRQFEDRVLEDERENDVLDDYSDEDMRSNQSSSANLTRRKPKIEELEMLLEAYFVQVEGTLNKLSTIREYVDNTEDYLNIILDDKQNRLLQFGVIMSIGFIILNIAIVITGVLGMNIGIHLFNSGVPQQFNATTAGLVGGSFICFLIAMIWIKKKGLLG
ncbi:hypothetical protein F0562_029020 [Nyssa sinensis]|uniref:Magnesium transporter n=1 Tax=Nyssa sinensis TaxID=561372 RepID=A0A5J5B3U1_9ASTE|nr:hypothetical protein F0562_029020 [Nyssa sinensis]